MWRVITLYGLALAAAMLVIEWLDYQHAVRAWSTEFYSAIVAVIFVVLGIWVGNRLTARPRSLVFERNIAAVKSLKISEREFQVLDLLATGSANKVIARKLNITPNTVKTHVARRYEKLDVGNRTEAIHRARELEILP